MRLFIIIIISKVRVAFYIITKIMRKISINKNNNECGNLQHWILNSSILKHFTLHKYILIDYKFFNKSVKINIMKNKFHNINIKSIHFIIKNQDNNFILIIIYKMLHVFKMNFNLFFNNVLLNKELKISMYFIKKTNILLKNCIIAKIISYKKF